jgi:hypothetical protein
MPKQEPTTGCVKGTAWSATYDYYLNRFGREGIQKVLNALSAEDRELFSKHILPVMWLNYGAFMRFVLTVDQVLGKGDRQLVKDASVYNAQRDLHGVYKMFISFTSPDVLIRSVPAFYRQMLNRGSMTAQYDRDAKRGSLKLVDFPDMPLYHEFDHLPYFEECFRLSRGGKNIRGSHPKCIARGDPYCLYEFTWD